MGQQVQTFVDENGSPIPIPIVRDGLNRPVIPMAPASGVQNGQFDSQGNFKVTLATALSQALDSILTYPRGTNYLNATASTLVLTGAGKLSGIWVTSAASTPTIKVWDNTAASGTVLLETFTPTAAQMYTFPNARIGTGIYLTIGGTVNCTVFYDPTTT